ncbi:hypothetical protein NDU88_004919 [Pleurodeles waltl]|uniref:Uncharacterized protein n=1 Tax=Pleurodeles waltl TaxID=8319 RepID=A0AAV7L0S7_PLEWA|nr:hypothetical protein NDU88_004919 [Pleurodeles waltl]
MIACEVVHDSPAGGSRQPWRLGHDGPGDTVISTQFMFLCLHNYIVQSEALEKINYQSKFPFHWRSLVIFLLLVMRNSQNYGIMYLQRLRKKISTGTILMTRTEAAATAYTALALYDTLTFYGALTVTLAFYGALTMYDTRAFYGALTLDDTLPTVHGLCMALAFYGALDGLTGSV